MGASTDEGTLAPSFLAKLDAFNANIVRQRFTHVIDRQGRDTRARQGFHFHAGDMPRFYGAQHNETTAARGLDMDLDMVDRQGMAKGDQLGRTLHCLDTCDDRRLKHRTFL